MVCPPGPSGNRRSGPVATAAYHAAHHAAADGLVQELEREIATGHMLSGLPIVAIAVRRLQKETIFWLPESAEGAVVHLTWNAEVDPRWPGTVLVKAWADVLSELVDRGRA